MIPDLFWIPGPSPGRLAISNRPRGGDWLEDEIRGWRGAHIDVVVSLLEEREESELDLSKERKLVEATGIRFVSFPIADRAVPASVQATAALVRRIIQALEEGKNVAIHCRQGIGRAALIAAGVLMAGGMDAEAALDVVGSARGLRVPETPQQREWLRTALADNLVMAPR